MYWQAWSGRLKQELSLDTEPVAVTFAGPPVAGTLMAQGKVSVCQALKRASQGDEVTITVETCGCPGDLVSLGLGQTLPGGKGRLAEFLINKEKVYCSRIAIHRGQKSVEPPAGVASRQMKSRYLARLMRRYGQDADTAARTNAAGSTVPPAAAVL